MKLHRTDGVSLTFAVLFAFVVASWILSYVVDLDLPTAGWLVAAALIFFGALGLVGTLRTGRHPQTEQSKPASAPPITPVSPGWTAPTGTASTDDPERP